jgi:hypothetical protein
MLELHSTNSNWRKEEISDKIKRWEIHRAWEWQKSKDNVKKQGNFHDDDDDDRY